ncbi:MAG: winged helix-turn-helix transcriptional regulator [Lachnospiraceae bacterium]|nr:winged helix-turn-helix transcriptional regulator [Lachnospiraceae bacterium]
MLDYDLTIEKMKAGLSRIRNRGIAEVFAYMHMIEGWGSGIPDMFMEARQYGLPEPLLEDMGSDFRVNLYRRVLYIDQNGVVIPNRVKVEGTNETNETKSETDETKSEADETKNETDLGHNEEKLLEAIRINPDITQKQLHEVTGISISTIKRILPELQKKEKLIRIGSRRAGTWMVK